MKKILISIVAVLFIFCFSACMMENEEQSGGENSIQSEEKTSDTQSGGNEESGLENESNESITESDEWLDVVFPR